MNGILNELYGMLINSKALGGIMNGANWTEFQSALFRDWFLCASGKC